MKEQGEIRRITALARDALWSDGPATAILVASHVRHLGLKEAPEAERVLLTSLHQLREERVVLPRDTRIVNEISYSPDGHMFVTPDPASLLFSDADSGVLIDTIDLGYLPIKSQNFAGPLMAAQWSPGGNWIAAGSRDQTLLIAPCSHKELKRQFAACADRDDDIVQVIGGALDRTGAAKFSADGKWMATGGFGTTLKLWDVLASPVRKLREFDGPVAWPNAFAISSDERTVAVGLGQSQGEIKLFDASSGQLLRTLGAGKVQHGSFLAIAFKPGDPGMLAASAQDGSIFVWDDWRDPERPRRPLCSRTPRGPHMRSSSAGTAVSWSAPATTACCGCGRPMGAKRIPVCARSGS
jgi:WD40 repeat protein